MAVLTREQYKAIGRPVTQAEVKAITRPPAVTTRIDRTEEVKKAEQEFSEIKTLDEYERKYNSLDPELQQYFPSPEDMKEKKQAAIDHEQKVVQDKLNAINYQIGEHMHRIEEYKRIAGETGQSQDRKIDRSTDKIYYLQVEYGEILKNRQYIAEGMSASEIFKIARAERDYEKEATERADIAIAKREGAETILQSPTAPLTEKKTALQLLKGLAPSVGQAESYERQYGTSLKEIGYRTKESEKKMAEVFSPSKTALAIGIIDVASKKETKVLGMPTPMELGRDIKITPLSEQQVTSMGMITPSDKQLAGSLDIFTSVLSPVATAETKYIEETFAGEHWSETMMIPDLTKGMGKETLQYIPATYEQLPIGQAAYFETFHKTLPETFKFETKQKELGEEITTELKPKYEAMAQAELEAGIAGITTQAEADIFAAQIGEKYTLKMQKELETVFGEKVVPFEKEYIKTATGIAEGLMPKYEERAKQQLVVPRIADTLILSAAAFTGGLAAGSTVAAIGIKYPATATIGKILGFAGIGGIVGYKTYGIEKEFKVSPKAGFRELVLSTYEIAAPTLAGIAGLRFGAKGFLKSGKVVYEKGEIRIQDVKEGRRIADFLGRQVIEYKHPFIKDIRLTRGIYIPEIHVKFAPTGKLGVVKYDALYGSVIKTKLPEYIVTAKAISPAEITRVKGLSDLTRIGYVKFVSPEKMPIVVGRGFPVSPTQFVAYKMGVVGKGVTSPFAFTETKITFDEGYGYTKEHLDKFTQYGIRTPDLSKVLASGREVTGTGVVYKYDIQVLAKDVEFFRTGVAGTTPKTAWWKTHLAVPIPPDWKTLPIPSPKVTAIPKGVSFYPRAGDMVFAKDVALTKDMPFLTQMGTTEIVQIGGTLALPTLKPFLGLGLITPTKPRLQIRQPLAKLLYPKSGLALRGVQITTQVPMTKQLLSARLKQITIQPPQIPPAIIPPIIEPPLVIPPMIPPDIPLFRLDKDRFPKKTKKEKRRLTKQRKAYQVSVGAAMLNISAPMKEIKKMKITGLELRPIPIQKPLRKKRRKNKKYLNTQNFIKKLNKTFKS